MPRQIGSSDTSAPPADSQVLGFISRAEQLDLRGRRNYDRYIQVTKGFVDPDSLERAEWQRESAEESMRDTEWNERHGPVASGASILRWRLGNEELALVERHKDAEFLDTPNG